MDKRIIKTKKNLYTGLLKVMETKTFENIKVSDICEEAMTNRSTFYDHFSDKYELLSSLLNDLKEQLIKSLEIKNRKDLLPKEYYMEVIKIFLNHIAGNIEIYNPILKMNDNSIVIDMIYDTLYKDIQKEIESNDRTDDIPAEVITKFYVTAVTNICLDYIKNPKKYNINTLLDYFNKLLPDKMY
ncbi:MAG: TetR/AcrR family transcriptional regulator C-terminal domain-containing protein [Bacilli bacterium]|nr:TetR/AcrR family transcriptional regulator C-terminal domain-containing protein [Bacilli bacterium]